MALVSVRMLATEILMRHYSTETSDMGGLSVGSLEDRN